MIRFIIWVWMLSIAFVQPGYAYEQIAEPQKFPTDMKRPGMGYASFEQYQQTVDDLFMIAMTLPRDDDKGGLNEMIIRLNKKITENPEDHEALISLGHLYRLLGEPSEANRFYQKALDINPREFHLHCFAALMLFQMGEYEESLKELTAAIKVDSTDVHAWLARGRTLARTGNYGAAIADFEKALELKPDNETAKMLLGQLYEKKGDGDKAYKIFEKLSSEDKGNSIAGFNLAIMKLRNNETDEAVTILESIFLEGERDLDFLFQLSMAYMQNKQYEKAQKVIGVLNFLFPDELTFDFLNAEIFRHSEQLDKAEQTFRMILVEDPEHVDAYIGLAITVAQKNTLVEGLRIFDEAIQLMPNNEKLQKWRAKLEKDYEDLISPDSHNEPEKEGGE